MNCIKDYFTDWGGNKLCRQDLINVGGILGVLNKQKPAWLVRNYERLLEENLQILRDDGLIQNEEWVIQVVTFAIWEHLDTIDSIAGTNFAEMFSDLFLDSLSDHIKIEDIDPTW